MSCEFDRESNFAILNDSADFVKALIQSLEFILFLKIKIPEQACPSDKPINQRLSVNSLCHSVSKNNLEKEICF